MDLPKEVALYIIDNHTIEEASAKFSKSVSSIKKYLAKVRDQNNPNYEPILAEKLRLAHAKIQLAGVKKGGAISKRAKKISLDEARKYANIYMSGYSYEQLEELTGIPKSTLQENIRNIPDLDLQIKLDEYTRNKGEIWKR